MMAAMTAAYHLIVIVTANHFSNIFPNWLVSESVAKIK
jgi:hypothetical protein